MSQIASALVTIVLISFISQLSSGDILGPIVSWKEGDRTGWAFAIGVTVARSIQGLLGAGVVLTILDQFAGSFRLDRTAWAFIALAGLAIVLASARSLLQPQAVDDEPETRTPEAGSAKAALGAGFGLNIISLKQWIFTGAIVTSIGRAEAGPAVTLGLFAVYLVLSQWLTVGILLVRYLRPSRSRELLDRLDVWMRTHIPRILAWIALLIGVAMLGGGLYALLG